MVKKDIGAAGVIVNSEGHVLLVQQSYGHFNWELPGGAAEADESIMETAQREVKEETGLSVIAKHLTGIYYQPFDDSVHFVFLCDLLTDAAVSQPDAEVTQCAYYAPDALPRPMSDFTERRIQDALSGVKQPLPAIVMARRWLD